MDHLPHSDPIWTALAFFHPALITFNAHLQIVETMVKTLDLDLHKAPSPRVDPRTPAEIALVCPQVLEHMANTLGLQVTHAARVTGNYRGCNNNIVEF